MPRKPKLTEELIEKAAHYVRAGNYISHVAQFLGIHRDTFYRWLSEGERAKSGLKRRFYDAIKKAEAEAVMRNVMIVQKKAEENWQAAAWWLERKFPEEWGRKDRINLDASGTVNLRITEVGPEDADHRRQDDTQD